MFLKDTVQNAGYSLSVKDGSFLVQIKVQFQISFQGSIACLGNRIQQGVILGVRMAGCSFPDVDPLTLTTMGLDFFVLANAGDGGISGIVARIINFVNDLD
jgi:hypothetical protein